MIKSINQSFKQKADMSKNFKSILTEGGGGV